MKQLGILLGSPFVSILFNLIVNCDFTIDAARVIISVVCLITSLKLFSNSYEILINLDKRINYDRS